MHGGQRTNPRIWDLAMHSLAIEEIYRTLTDKLFRDPMFPWAPVPGITKTYVSLGPCAWHYKNRRFLWPMGGRPWMANHGRETMDGRPRETTGDHDKSNGNHVVYCVFCILVTKIFSLGPYNNKKLNHKRQLVL